METRADKMENVRIKGMQAWNQGWKVKQRGEMQTADDDDDDVRKRGDTEQDWIISGLVSQNEKNDIALSGTWYMY